MSVLKSLKGTFQNVQQDIVDGLRALTSLDSTPRHEKLKQLRAEGISLDAGADMLYRYQKDWSELQGFTTETAKKAEEVDSIVGEIFTKSEQQWQSACHLEEEAANLPNIASTLNSMIELIGSLQQDFQAVEEELDKLQNICEEEALEREKNSQMSQLNAYKKKKEAEAFTVKGKLWSMLKDKAKELETRKSHAMKERQEALMDAFTSDMDYYRTHGHPDRLHVGTEFPKVSSLSDITIEEDKKALDDFLDTGVGAHGELTHEAFFEDDYTADYSATEEHHEHIPQLDDRRPIDFDDNKDVNDADHSEKKDSKSDGADKTETSGGVQTDEQSLETQETEQNSVPNLSNGDVSTGSSQCKESEGKPENAADEA